MSTVGNQVGGSFIVNFDILIHGLDRFVWIKYGNKRSCKYQIVKISKLFPHKLATAILKLGLGHMLRLK